MDRTELKCYIMENYNANADNPWVKFPDFEVFRHVNNKKWFALVMDIPRNKLGLQGDDLLDVVNVKCDPVLISSMLTENGIFPAYHMNKNSWVTIALDGSASDETIKMLLDISYQATAPKIKPKKH